MTALISRMTKTTKFLLIVCFNGLGISVKQQRQQQIGCRSISEEIVFVSDAAAAQATTAICLAPFWRSSKKVCRIGRTRSRAARMLIRSNVHPDSRGTFGHGQRDIEILQGSQAIKLNLLSRRPDASGLRKAPNRQKSSD